MRNVEVWASVLVVSVGIMIGVAPHQAAAESSSASCSVLIILPPRDEEAASSPEQLAAASIPEASSPVPSSVQRQRTTESDGTVLYTDTPLL